MSTTEDDANRATEPNQHAAQQDLPGCSSGGRRVDFRRSRLTNWRAPLRRRSGLGWRVDHRLLKGGGDGCHKADASAGSARRASSSASSQRNGAPAARRRRGRCTARPRREGGFTHRVLGGCGRRRRPLPQSTCTTSPAMTRARSNGKQRAPATVKRRGRCTSVASPAPRPSRFGQSWRPRARRKSGSAPRDELHADVRGGGPYHVPVRSLGRFGSESKSRDVTRVEPARPGAGVVFSSSLTAAHKPAP